MNEEKEVQLIEHNRFLEDLILRPVKVTRLFISNIVQRSIAVLRGFDGDRFPFLQCTSSGILKTTSTGTIFEDNYTFTGNAGDVPGVGLGFVEPMNRVEIWVTGNDIVLERTKDGVLWQDPIKLTSGSYYMFEAASVDVRVYNAVPGNIAGYQVVSWC